MYFFLLTLSLFVLFLSTPSLSLLISIFLFSPPLSCTSHFSLSLSLLSLIPPSLPPTISLYLLLFFPSHALRYFSLHTVSLPSLFLFSLPFSIDLYISLFSLLCLCVSFSLSSLPWYFSLLTCLFYLYSPSLPPLVFLSSHMPFLSLFSLTPSFCQPLFLSIFPFFFYFSIISPSPSISLFEFSPLSLSFSIYFYFFPFEASNNIECLLTRYIRLVKKHGLEISQPGLEPYNGLTWKMTERKPESEVHK